MSKLAKVAVFLVWYAATLVPACYLIRYGNRRASWWAYPLLAGTITSCLWILWTA